MARSAWFMPLLALAVACKPAARGVTRVQGVNEPAQETNHLVLTNPSKLKDSARQSSEAGVRSCAIDAIGMRFDLVSEPAWEAGHLRATFRVQRELPGCEWARVPASNPAEFLYAGYVYLGHFEQHLASSRYALPPEVMAQYNEAAATIVRRAIDPRTPEKEKIPTYGTTSRGTFRCGHVGISGACFGCVAAAYDKAGLNGMQGAYAAAAEIPASQFLEVTRWVPNCNRTDVSGEASIPKGMPPGTVVVYDHGTYGHIEIMFDDDFACSDFCNIPAWLSGWFRCRRVFIPRK